MKNGIDLLTISSKKQIILFFIDFTNEGGLGFKLILWACEWNYQAQFAQVSKIDKKKYLFFVRRWNFLLN